MHLALVGPTASGKSGLALELARRLGDLEILSADSMQVYRGMDIGTAKATPAERDAVPHHLLDLADPGEDFSVARFQAAARDVIDQVEGRAHRALLVGGTGLYVQAVVDELLVPGQWPEVRAELEAEPETAALHRRLHELDPLAASRMEPGNRRRVIRALEVTLGSGRPFSQHGPGVGAFPATTWRVAGLWLPRAVVRARIAERYRWQMEAGFLDEVRRLAPGPLSRTARQALGYKELLAHLAGDATVEEAIELARRRTVAFARRQRVWFRRDPRVTWFGAAAEPLDVLPALLAWARKRSASGSGPGRLEVHAPHQAPRPG